MVRRFFYGENYSDAASRSISVPVVTCAFPIDFSQFYLIGKELLGSITKTHLLEGNTAEELCRMEEAEAARR